MSKVPLYGGGIRHRAELPRAHGAARFDPVIHLSDTGVYEPRIHLKSQGPSRTCNESKEEEEEIVHLFHARPFEPQSKVNFGL